MKTIVVGNRKGGVGKTSIAYNLGASYMLEGKSVLFIDLDSQGNLTTLLKQEPVSLEEWKEFKPLQLTDKLYVLPATKRFSQLENEINELFNRNSYLKKTVFPELSIQADVVIIDTPPALNILNINAFCVADTVLIPVQADSFSLTGLLEMRDILEQVKELNPSLQYKTVLNAYFTGRTLTDGARDAIQADIGHSGVEIPHRQHLINCNAERRPALDNRELYTAFEGLRRAV